MKPFRWWGRSSAQRSCPWSRVGRPVAGPGRDRGRRVLAADQELPADSARHEADHGVNPLVTLLAITAFGSVLGIAGAVFAIPMAAIVRLILSRWLFGDEARQAKPPEGRDSLSVVQYEVRS